MSGRRGTAPPLSSPEIEKSWSELLHFSLPYVWPAGETALRTRVVAAFACLLAAKVVTLYVPFFLKWTIDALDTPGIEAIPLALLIGYGAARLFASLFQQMRDALFARVGARAGRRLALAVYTHLFDLSLRYHLERRTGELARAIDRGVKALSFLLRTALFSLVPTFLEFAMVIGILLWNYPPSFAGIVFVTIVGYAVFTVVTTNWRTIIRRELNAADNAFNASAVDGLINYEVVKAFANEGHERQRLDGQLATYEHAAVRSEVSLAYLNGGQAAIIAIGVSVLMIMAAQGVVSGALSIGDVVLLNTFLLQLYQPLNFLGVVYREIRQSLTDLEHIEELMRLSPEVADKPGAEPLAVADGTVRFSDVNFAYDDRRPLVKGLDFTLAGGQKLGIVGPTGAGKSTIVRLLFRFYDTGDGAVTIDGQDIRDVTQDSLRAQIGLVPQDTVLFNDTIEANIAYGRPGAARAEIEEAARLAQIHDFIAGQPDGYRSIVGERGLKLSGGEKQRVAIARVLLKNPPILILDEATSALDSTTEHSLQEALSRAATGRTTLVIAHRLSTITDADQIIVMDAGRIVERGTHSELVAEAGLYAQLWQRQQAEVAELAADPASTV